MATRVLLAALALLMVSACRQERTPEPTQPAPTAESADELRDAKPDAEPETKAISAAAPQEREVTPLKAPAVIPDPSDEDLEYQILELLATRRTAVVEDPGSLGAWMDFGIACDAHKLYGCAEVCYRQCLALSPNDFASMYYLAYVLHASGRDDEESIRLYRAAAKIEPKYPPLYYRLGEALERRGKLPEALDAYLDAMNVDYEFAPAHRAAGIVRLALGEEDAAFKSLRYAVKIAPTDSENLLTLEEASIKTGRHLPFRSSRMADPNRVKPDVADPVREIVKDTAIDSVTLFVRAKAKIHAGEHAKAIPDLKIVEHATPNDPYVQLHLGTCYRRTGDRGLAAAHLKNAVRLKEDSAGAQLEFASLLIEIGRLEEGLYHYDLAVSHSFKPRDIHIWIGAALFNKGHMRYAAEAYESAYKIASLDARSFSRWGTALFRTGDYEGAAEKYKRATYVNPGYVDAFYNRGISLEKVGKLDEAITQYEKVLSLEPDHPRAGKRLASIAPDEP